VFYLGGAPGVAETAAKRLQARWPGVQIATAHGYFDMEADSANSQYRVETINRFGPDVIFVGMGMPRQEAWIARNYDALRSGVVFSVGAAFDYEAGAQIAAPRWLGRVGLEWLFRFAVDPKRLFIRYFVEPWSLIRPALQDLAEKTRRPDEPVATP
jgi:N-acetylglucosaminyldiphosphoundecaprenol N-acetyl-beta-D-mannosaminyltransferase